MAQRAAEAIHVDAFDERFGHGNVLLLHAFVLQSEILTWDSCLVQYSGTTAQQ